MYHNNQFIWLTHVHCSLVLISKRTVELIIYINIHQKIGKEFKLIISRCANKDFKLKKNVTSSKKLIGICNPKHNSLHE